MSDLYQAIANSAVGKKVFSSLNLPIPVMLERHRPDQASFINGAVLVPTYDDPADEEALARLRACFPGREVIGIPCAPLILQNGSLHCVTMQLPAAVPV